MIEKTPRLVNSVRDISSPPKKEGQLSPSFLYIEPGEKPPCSHAFFLFHPGLYSLYVTPLRGAIGSNVVHHDVIYLVLL